jgi:superfamily II DNA or RNA helicase
MSVSTNIEKLPWQTRQRINRDLEIKIESKYGGQDRLLHLFEVDEDDIKLPFAYAVRNLGVKRPKRETFPGMDVPFTWELRDEQKEVVKESLGFLNKTGSIIVCAYPGFGKTCMAIYKACVIGFKTLIIVNTKLILANQWEENIIKFCPDARILKITSKIRLTPEIMTKYDFFIINAPNVEKMGKTCFSQIGTVIVDEAHMIMAETLHRSLRYVQPRYLIGLTATPYRPDGFDILLELFFGKDKIIRKLWRKHIAYKVMTGFKPRMEKTANGRVNWGVVLDSQATDEARNELIVKILRKYSDRNPLVLVKRVTQGEYLVRRLEEEGESVTSLLGDNQEFDESARILIGTCQKVGVGFDRAKSNMLVLATDVEEYFIQYLGRVFRTKDVEPLVFDLLDINPILNKHFATRQSIYQQHGGIVRNFDIKTLD